MNLLEKVFSNYGINKNQLSALSQSSEYSEHKNFFDELFRLINFKRGQNFNSLMDDLFILNDLSNKANYPYNIGIVSYSPVFEAFVIVYFEKFGDIRNQMFISKYRTEIKEIYESYFFFFALNSQVLALEYQNDFNWQDSFDEVIKHGFFTSDMLEYISQNHTICFNPTYGGNDVQFILMIFMGMNNLSENFVYAIFNMETSLNNESIRFLSDIYQSDGNINPDDYGMFVFTDEDFDSLGILSKNMHNFKSDALKLWLELN